VLRNCKSLRGEKSRPRAPKRGRIVSHRPVNYPVGSTVHVLSSNKKEEHKGEAIDKGGGEEQEGGTCKPQRSVQAGNWASSHLQTRHSMTEEESGGPGRKSPEEVLRILKPTIGQGNATGREEKSRTCRVLLEKNPRAPPYNQHPVRRGRRVEHNLRKQSEGEKRKLEKNKGSKGDGKGASKFHQKCF